jgi:cellulose biosynthesis protein BcsE
MKENMTTKTSAASKQDNAEPAMPSVAIDGLDMSMREMDVGRAYLICAEDSPARDAVLWQTAVSILGGKGVLIFGLEPEEIIIRLHFLGIFAESKGSLHVNSHIFSVHAPDFSFNEQATNQDRIIEPSRLLDAMQSVVDQCKTKGYVFLLEGIDAFISWDSAEELACTAARISDWAEQTGCTVLLLLRLPVGNVNVRGFQNNFSGAAQIKQVDGEYAWDTVFWNTSGFAVGSEKVPLRFSSSGRLQVREWSRLDAQLSPDEHLVIISQEAIIRERWVPSAWQVVDGNDVIVDRRQHLIAATVILDCAGRKFFESVAQDVFKLRSTCGKALKIIVREQSEAMRHDCELFLLSIGANLVLSKDVPFARMESMIQSIQGKIYSKPVVTDFHEALSAAMVEKVSGYVDSKRFVLLTHSAMDRSRDVRVPNVLLKLPLLPEVSHIDALRSCQFRAGGDLCTASRDSIFIFLFACRMADVDNVLQRIFAIPVADLFDSEIRFGDEASIEAQIDLLEVELREAPPVDFSGWIARDVLSAGSQPVSSAAVTSFLSTSDADVAESDAAVACLQQAVVEYLPQLQQSGALDLEASVSGNQSTKTALLSPAVPFLIPLKRNK